MTPVESLIQSVGESSPLSLPDDSFLKGKFLEKRNEQRALLTKNEENHNQMFSHFEDCLTFSNPERIINIIQATYFPSFDHILFFNTNSISKLKSAIKQLKGNEKNETKKLKKTNKQLKKIIKNLFKSDTSFIENRTKALKILVIYIQKVKSRYGKFKNPINFVEFNTMINNLKAQALPFSNQIRILATHFNISEEAAEDRYEFIVAQQLASNETFENFACKFEKNKEQQFYKKTILPLFQELHNDVEKFHKSLSIEIKKIASLTKEKLIAQHFKNEIDKIINRYNLFEEYIQMEIKNISSLISDNEAAKTQASNTTSTTYLINGSPNPMLSPMATSPAFTPTSSTYSSIAMSPAFTPTSIDFQHPM